MNHDQIAAALAALTDRQSIDVINAMTGHKPGRDVKRMSLAEKHAMLAAMHAGWQVSAPQITCEHWASAIARATVRAPAIPAPAAMWAAPAPAAAIAAPAAPEPVAPAIVEPVAPAPATVAPEPVILAATSTMGTAPAAPYAGRAPMSDAVADRFGAPAPMSAPMPGTAPDIGAPEPAIAAPAQVPGAPYAVRYVRDVFSDVPGIEDVVPAELTCKVYAHGGTEKINPNYFWDAGLVFMLCAAIESSPTLNVWIQGERGTGKSMAVEQLCARLGRQLFRTVYSRATEPVDIIGAMGAVNMSSVWKDGPIVLAMKTPGAVYLGDEFDYGAPAHHAAVNGILDRGGADTRLPTGERLHRAEDVAFIVCANTNGHGDMTGNYPGRATMGADIHDRFPLRYRMSYLKPAQESKLLRARVKKDTGKSLLKPVADAIVHVFGVLRTKSGNNEIRGGAPSTRAAEAMALLIARGMQPIDAYTSTVILASPDESAEVLQQVWAASWPADLGIDVAAFFN